MSVWNPFSWRIVAKLFPNPCSKFNDPRVKEFPDGLIVYFPGDCRPLTILAWPNDAIGPGSLNLGPSDPLRNAGIVHDHLYQESAWCESVGITQLLADLELRGLSYVIASQLGEPYIFTLPPIIEAEYALVRQFGHIYWDSHLKPDFAEMEIKKSLQA